jgi:hypothetical protein
VLQGIIRPTEVTIGHLEALGVHVLPDSEPETIIPDPSYIPDFASWDALSYDEAREANNSTKRRLNTGTLSPGVQTYHDRKRELFIDNNVAFRTIRRLPQPPGQSLARLGGAYEFFKNLESFTNFWDDTSQKDLYDQAVGNEGPGNGGKAAHDVNSGSEHEGKKQTTEIRFHRLEAGTQMPPEYRLNLLTSFLKMVAYDFGCNVSAPRTEPRLSLNSLLSAQPLTEKQPKSKSKSSRSRSSYFTSGCTFIYRSPQTREAARQGIVEGPVAALSARHTTSFTPFHTPSATDAAAGEQTQQETDRDSVLDLARELVAALITAQHRAREGRAEKRAGEGAWWATKPRWGGGTGGPIGREADNIPLSAAPRDAADGSPPKKKSLAMYDGYRIVRPPSANWDKKMKYTAIGRVAGAAHDDIFVASALFHHIAILRVRVPARLLEVLDGAEDAPARARSWGRLEVARSRWFDLFITSDRFEAMKLVWAMMAWMMRGDAKDGEGDVKMG